MVRVGLVGAGARGRLFAEVIDQHPSATVAGIADPSADRGRINGLPWFDDHDALFAEVELDAVIIATPDPCHRAPVIEAAKRSLPMLVEKPFAMNSSEGDAMADVVIRNGAPLMVGFENRWNPHFVRIKNAINANEVGHIIWQHAELSNSQFVPRQLLSWSGMTSPIWFLMPHTVDLVTWLAGSPVSSVYAVGSRGVLEQKGVDTWDAVQVMLTLDDGSSASLTSSWVLPMSMPNIVEFSYDINGENGAIRADLTDQGLKVFGDSAEFRSPLEGGIGRQLAGAPVWMVNDFLNAVESQSFDGPGLTEGLEVTYVLEAVERSLATGSPVSVGRP